MGMSKCKYHCYKLIPYEILSNINLTTKYHRYQGTGPCSTPQYPTPPFFFFFYFSSSLTSNHRLYIHCKKKFKTRYLFNINTKCFDFYVLFSSPLIKSDKIIKIFVTELVKKIVQCSYVNVEILHLIHHAERFQAASTFYTSYLLTHRYKAFMTSE